MLSATALLLACNPLITRPTSINSVNVVDIRLRFSHFKSKFKVHSIIPVAHNYTDELANRAIQCTVRIHAIHFILAACRYVGQLQ